MNTTSDKSQFNLRSVFYVTLLACVLVAVFAPVLRGFQSEQWKWFLVQGVFQLVTIVTSLFFNARWRRSALQRAGVKSYGTSFKEAVEFDSSRDVSPMNYLLMMLLFQFWILYRSAKSEDAALLGGAVVFQILILIIVCRKFWSLVWAIDHTDIELFECGVIHGGYHFVRWDEIALARPSEHFKNQIAIDLKPGHQQTHFGLILRQTLIWGVIPQLRDEILRRINAQLASSEPSD